MKKFGLILPLCLLLIACGHRVMTLSSYQEVPMGTSDVKLREMVGDPYATHQLKDGKVEYEYIERISMGSNTVEERHYFFVLKNGQVINKYMKSASPPPYNENSYDMQTTTNNDTAQ